jgi:hypothetical protein
MVLKPEHFRKQITNTLKAFKCGTGGGWRRSVKDALKTKSMRQSQERKEYPACTYRDRRKAN